VTLTSVIFMGTSSVIPSLVVGDPSLGLLRRSRIAGSRA
jgi:hypothetical protein